MAQPKHCPACGEIKPVSEFGRNRQTPDGLMYYCRTCATRKQKEFREANPDSAKASKKKYLDKIRARNDEKAAQRVSAG